MLHAQMLFLAGPSRTAQYPSSLRGPPCSAPSRPSSSRQARWRPARARLGRGLAGGLELDVLAVAHEAIVKRSQRARCRYAHRARGVRGGTRGDDARHRPRRRAAAPDDPQSVVLGVRVQDPASRPLVRTPTSAFTSAGALVPPYAPGDDLSPALWYGPDATTTTPSARDTASRHQTRPFRAVRA